ncbi:MAG: AMP-binding protein, partial [Candidatus Thorarchaeota archaeon]
QKFSLIMIHTIPYKIPETILVNLEKRNYDKIILFALGVFGPHKMKELINDPKNSIENKLDKALFSQWAEKLKGEQFIEEFELDGELNFRITSKGEEELLSYIKKIGILKILEKTIGPIEKENEVTSESVYDFKITYKNYVFGLLSLIWRLDTFLIADEFEKIGPDKKVSLGKCLEYNALKFPENNALLYEDQVYTYKELNENVNRYCNFFLSLGIEKGEIINVFLENRPELMFIMAAMSKIGTIGSLINTRQRAATLRFSLKLNKVRIYLIGEELIDAFEEVKEDLDLIQEDKLFFC